MEKSSECVGYVVKDGAETEMPFLTYKGAMQYCKQIGITPDDTHISCDLCRAKNLAKIMLEGLIYIQNQIEPERQKAETNLNCAIASRNQLTMMQMGVQNLGSAAHVSAQNCQNEIFSRQGKTHGITIAVTIIDRRIGELQALVEMHD